MGFAKKYFPEETSSPAPLVAVARRRVRFEEVDVLGMVWHGRFPSFLEDGRIAFGDSYGLTYQKFIQYKTIAPVVQMHLDYKIPLRFDESFQIETVLHWSDAARLNFSYSITKEGGAVAATGYTVQLLTDESGAVLLVLPSWIEDFRHRWREGLWRN